MSSNPLKEGSDNPSFRPADSVVNLLRCEWGIVQRLFSTFADGWPGIGLILLRLLSGAEMIHFGITGILEGTPPLIIALQVIGGIELTVDEPQVIG